MTPEIKAFIESIAEATALGTSHLPLAASEIHETFTDALTKKLDELNGEKAAVNDFVDACEKVVLTTGKAFGSEKAQQLCQDIVDASNAGQEGQYIKVIGEGFQIIHGIKAVARENKAKKNK